jgi:molybdate transport system permease protein
MIIGSMAFFFFPLLAVFIKMNPVQLFVKLNTSTSYQALLLSMQTTVIALLMIVVFGTPLAYWLSKSRFRGKKIVEIVLQLPIVTPPAVAGVGLLLVFGQTGFLGRYLVSKGIHLAFNQAAVVLAQIFVSAPFYMSTARQAFDTVDEQLIDVSRTLGVTPWRTFWRVTIPLAWPGLVSGIALSWARALGEFGATMMFAGNLPGKTQTLPLAIYSAMQADMDVAIAISVLLLTVSFFLLLVVGINDKRKRIERFSR